MTREQAIHILRTLAGIMMDSGDNPGRLMDLTVDDGMDLENIAYALERRAI